MRRFVLRQNIIRFEQALETESDASKREPIRRMLVSTRRDLALLEAQTLGAQAAPARSSASPEWRAHELAVAFRDAFDNSPHPCMVLDPSPGLNIIDLNRAHREATHCGRDVIGRPLFDVFPDDPANPGSDGVHNLYATLRAAADSGQQQTMAAHRYDMRGPDGRFIERHWRAEITPLIDDRGRLLFLLHKAEDVSGALTAARAVV